MGRNRGGTKVPGVKLRPAEPKPLGSKKNVIESDDDDGIVPPTPPRGPTSIFRDVSLCATGIKNKREVFDLVKRMGGTHSTDFTDMTTHLLAEAPGSQKYKCAIERGVPVLSPTWVYEAHERWVSGEVFSPETTIDSHRLLPFRGVRLCVTGIDTADVRARIHKLMKLNGGEYLKNLDKTCTHVLCAVDTSEKVNWTNKVNRDREITRIRAPSQDIPDPIQLVWEEWFWDCVYSKGLLDCQPYHIANPRPEPMSKSVMESPEVSTIALPQQPRMPAQLPLASLLSDPGDTIAQVKRKKDAGMKEWESIVKRQGYTVVNGEMRNIGTSSYSMDLDESFGRSSSSPMKKAWVSNNLEPPLMAKGWSRRSPVKKQGLRGISDVSSSPRKPLAIRLPAETDDADSAPQSAVSFLGKMSRSTAFDTVDKQQEPKVDAEAEPSPLEPSKQVFSGIAARLLGDAASDKVGNAWISAGGKILTEGIPDYYIVRLVGGDQHMLAHPEAEHSKFRTECWLERSLFEGKLCAVEENVTYAPIVILSPPDGELLIHLSGLDTAERTWVSRLLRLLGMEISAGFSAKCTHLVCPSREGVKCKKAEEWKIPVVDLEWVKELAIKATIDKQTRTPSPGTGRAHLPMEKSLEAMKLDIRAPAPPFELLQRQGAISPVFKVATPTGVDAFERAPSPKSPSPQGKRVLQPRIGITETTDVSSKTSRPGLLFSATKTARFTPAKPQATQRVPSSASPSPLKLQGPAFISKDPPNFATTSAFTLQANSAKALSRNIGAILGAKRSAEDDLDGASVASDVGENGPRKRPRRPQSNLAKSLKEQTPKKITLATILPTYGHERDSFHEEESASSLSLMESPPEQQGGVVVGYMEPIEVEEEKQLHIFVKGVELKESESTSTVKRPTKALKPRRSGRNKG